MKLSSPETHAVLSIAGSDPSGGAGVQADLKTFAVLGVYGCAAITCLTAQNTQGVSATLPVDPDFVRQQIHLVLNDLPITHVKTGMIYSGAIAEAVGEALADFKGEIICDPVMMASDGHDLLRPDADGSFKKHLLSHATVLTPNIPELKLLSGHDCSRQEEARMAGLSLFDQFENLQAVVVKGGHQNEQRDEITDTLLLRPTGTGAHRILQQSHRRIETSNTHGTGCTFASAFAAFHLLTGNYEISFQRAVNFIDQLLKRGASLTIGKGHGSLPHHLYIP